ncbi:hypothetical protein GCM10022233_09340 [Streptomyces shaanxiensis]|uniref:Uncharacterized protein n=1 Tax=Streptomyces shaanxiensis TaxID=653357 RepID=A0ABP7UFX5_9ACTN
MRLDVRGGVEGVEEGEDTGGVDALGGGGTREQRANSHAGILSQGSATIEGTGAAGRAIGCLSAHVRSDTSVHMCGPISTAQESHP